MSLIENINFWDRQKGIEPTTIENLILFSPLINFYVGKPEIRGLDEINARRSSALTCVLTYGDILSQESAFIQGYVRALDDLANHLCKNRNSGNGLEISASIYASQKCKRIAEDVLEFGTGVVIERLKLRNFEDYF